MHRSCNADLSTNFNKLNSFTVWLLFRHAEARSRIVPYTSPHRSALHEPSFVPYLQTRLDERHAGSPAPRHPCLPPFTRHTRYSSHISTQNALTLRELQLLRPLLVLSVQALNCNAVQNGQRLSIRPAKVHSSPSTRPSCNNLKLPLDSTHVLYPKSSLTNMKIDAMGRDVIIGLQSRAGSRNTSVIVGMVFFCQFWYWYRWYGLP